jgi:hypothetical protein
MDYPLCNLFIIPDRGSFCRLGMTSNGRDLSLSPRSRSRMVHNPGAGNAENDSAAKDKGDKGGE